MRSYRRAGESVTVKIVTDLHSATDALRREVTPSDVLLLLGDLVNVIDYTQMDGLLIDLYGHEAVKEVLELRMKGRFDQAGEVMRQRRDAMGVDVANEFRARLRAAYDEVAAALPASTYVIGGNIDPPEMLQAISSASVEMADGRAIEIDGMRVGFIGGGLPTPLRVAGEVDEEVFNEKVDALGSVDVLCSHVPPDLPELTWDILANRHERGSVRLLRYIREFQPRIAVFGHIHQPLVSSSHVGRTHLLNAGYFRRTERAVVLRRQ